jgi:hypothetical protein
MVQAVSCHVLRNSVSSDIIGVVLINIQRWMMPVGKIDLFLMLCGHGKLA